MVLIPCSRVAHVNLSKTIENLHHNFLKRQDFVCHVMRFNISVKGWRQYVSAGGEEPASRVGEGSQRTLVRLLNVSPRDSGGHTGSALVVREGQGGVLPPSKASILILSHVKYSGHGDVGLVIVSSGRGRVYPDTSIGDAKPAIANKHKNSTRGK